MMKSCIDNGLFLRAIYLFNEMRTGCQADFYTFPLVIRAISCVNDHFELGEGVHALGIKMGFQKDIYFCNTMIQCYIDYDCISFAHYLFDEMLQKDVVSWTSLISGYVKLGDIYESSRLFSEMRFDGCVVTPVNVAVMLRGCCLEGDLSGGRQIHGFVMRSGLKNHELVQNSILTFYSKAGSSNETEKFFGEIEKRDAVTWNIMMSMYSMRGETSKVTDCFRKMAAEAVPSHETVTLLASAFSKTGDLLEGKKLHSYALKCGKLDAILQSSFVVLYAKCGELSAASQLFEEVKGNNRGACRMMLWGFIRNREFIKAIDLLVEVLAEGFDLHVDILKGLVISYAYLGSLRMGKTVHGYWIRRKYGNGDDESLMTSILYMYVKCGHVSLARNCFNCMLVKDIVAWSSMVEGYAVHGQGVEALKLFNEMLKQRVVPNSISFLSVLNACSHSGLVEEGCQVFACMTEIFRMEPKLNHYTCMVDLLGRSGKLYEALEVINSMNVKADGRIWGSLLASCRMHSDGILGTYAARRLFKLEPDNVGYQVLLSNIHANYGNWNQVEDIRNFMSEEFNKNPGWSCIEVNEEFNLFAGGDRAHSLAEENNRMVG